MKSNAILWIFLAVILLAAAGYMVAFLAKRKNESRFRELEERKLKLFDLPVIAEIDAVQQMHLVGQSQTAFREWQEKWLTLSTTDFAELETKIFDAENLNQTFKFKEVNAAFIDAEETMEKMELNVSEIRAGLKYLHDQEANNSVAVQEALDKYEEVKKNIEENADKYGPAIEIIQEEKTAIDNQFKQFMTLNSSGDPMEASSILVEAEEKAKELEEKASLIPAYFEELNQEFPVQMKEIKSGYDKLVEQKYAFPDKALGEKIEKTTSRIQENLENLRTLNLEAVKDENVAISHQIDKLYETMEREIEAKTFVEENIKTTKDYINHISANNHQLEIELDHISQSYALNRNEQGRTKDFQKEMDDLTGKFVEIESKLKEESIVYSVLETEIKDYLTALDAIENKQIEINESLTELREGEKVAQKKVDEFEFALRNIKRHVDKQRLPGLPKDYLDFFYVATDRLEDLSRELNKMRIDMDRINQLVDFCGKDIEVLEEKTEDLIDSAALTEQMLQYSNRYRVTDAEMAKAVEKSYQLFTQTYRYADALDEIGVALERVEPGAFKRIEAAYFNTKGDVTQF